MTENEKLGTMGLIFLSLFPYGKYVIFQDNFEKFLIAVGVEIVVLILICLTPVFLKDVMTWNEEERKKEILSTCSDYFKRIESDVRSLKYTSENSTDQLKAQIKRMTEQLNKIENQKETLPDRPPQAETNTELIDQIIS